MGVIIGDMFFFGESVRQSVVNAFFLIPFQLTTFGNYPILPSPEVHHYACSDIFLAQSRAISLQNLAIFGILIARVGF